MAPTAAAPKSSAPYWLTLPDWTGWRAWPLSSASGARCVDGAVDHTLVDVACRPSRRSRLPRLAGPVDDAVDDVLVDPVGRFRDRVGDSPDDHLLVQIVEIELVDEEPVAGSSEPVAFASNPRTGSCDRRTRRGTATPRGRCRRTTRHDRDQRHRPLELGVRAPWARGRPRRVGASNPQPASSPDSPPAGGRLRRRSRTAPSSE